MVGFNNPWYAEMIERFTTDADKKDAPEIKAACILSRSLLAAVCILAQAIDGLSERVGGSEGYPVNNVADEIRCGLDGIAEAIKEGHQEP